MVHISSLNSYSISGASSCTACSIGSFCVNGVQKSCVAGTYQPLTGQGSCFACTAGFWSQVGNGNLCSPIPCSTQGYVGVDGNCTCSIGYVGSVNYSNGILSGCLIECLSPQFTGPPGACSCSRGYGTPTPSLLSNQTFYDR